MRHPLAFFVLFLAAGCDAPEPRAASAVAGLPEYTPEEASFFGDILEPSAFGLPTDVSPLVDPKLKARAERADAVIRVRVATVSQELLAGKMGYTIALTVDPGPLAGAPPESPLEIRIGSSSPSLALVQSEDTHFVGKRFVVFVRRYARHGEPELHFHGEGDTPEFEQAFAQSKALDDAAGKRQTRD
jgi:hypothetical protein